MYLYFKFDIMKLKIENNGKVYLVNVEKRGKYYVFILRRKNSLIHHCEEYSFYKFSCSIICRLKHYKNFKKEIFNPEYSRIFFDSTS